MAKTPTKTRIRRTDEQLIDELLAKIAGVKRRAAQRSMRKDPALRHISAALRSIGKAAKESKDPATRQALDEARATLSACLSLNRAAPSAGGRAVAPQPRRSGTAVTPASLLDHVRNHPGDRAEQIGAALGIDTKAMRPVMQDLIAQGKVKTRGRLRGTSYHPV